MGFAHLHIDVQHHAQRDARVALYSGVPDAKGGCRLITRPLSVRESDVGELVEILRTGATQRRVSVTVREHGRAA